MATGDAAIREEGERERSRLVARAGVVGAGTLASRVLGLLRDMVLAAVFDRDATDAWWVAFTIPNALRQLLGEGAVSSAVVPVLSEKLANDGDAAARVFFARIRGASLVALAVVSVLGVVFAGPLTALFAGGYRARPGELERTTMLTRVVFPYIFFVGSAALGMAALNAKRRFAVAAFAPGLLNVALLAAALGLPGILAAAGYDPVLSLALGALVGGVLQVVAQWPALRAIGYAGVPRLALDPDVRKVFRRLGPLALGVGVYYVDLVLSRRFLSDLGPGAQSYFSWAMRLCDFPQGIFVMALSTAALPSLSTLAARGDRTELAKTWAHGMCLALFVAIPASAALLALGEPIVVALFQRGAFDAVGRARDGAGSLLARRRHLDGRRRAPDRARVLRAGRHADAGGRERDRPRRLHRAGRGAQGAPRARRDQRRRGRLERGADGDPARCPALAHGDHRGGRAGAVDGADARCFGRGGRGRVELGEDPRAGGTRRRHRARPSRAAGPCRVHGSVCGRRVGDAVAGARGDHEDAEAPARARAIERPGMKAEKETRVVEATFVAGAVEAAGLPAPTSSEVAFAGRSNVGKSSLLNAMMQRHSLARTSRTPGCTRQLNVFHVACSDGLQRELRRPPRLRLGAPIEDRAKRVAGHDSRATCATGQPSAPSSSSSTSVAAPKTRSAS